MTGGDNEWRAVEAEVHGALKKDDDLEVVLDTGTAGASGAVAGASEEAGLITAMVCAGDADDGGGAGGHGGRREIPAGMSMSETQVG